MPGPRKQSGKPARKTAGGSSSQPYWQKPLERSLKPKKKKRDAEPGEAEAPKRRYTAGGPPAARPGKFSGKPGGPSSGFGKSRSAGSGDGPKRPAFRGAGKPSGDARGRSGDRPGGYAPRDQKEGYQGRPRFVKSEGGAYDKPKSFGKPSFDKPRAFGKPRPFDQAGTADRPRAYGNSRGPAKPSYSKPSYDKPGYDKPRSFDRPQRADGDQRSDRGAAAGKRGFDGPRNGGPRSDGPPRFGRSQGYDKPQRFGKPQSFGKPQGDRPNRYDKPQRSDRAFDGPPRSDRPRQYDAPQGYDKPKRFSKPPERDGAGSKPFGKPSFGSRTPRGPKPDGESRFDARPPRKTFVPREGPPRDAAPRGRASDGAAGERPPYRKPEDQRPPRTAFGDRPQRTAPPRRSRDDNFDGPPRRRPDADEPRSFSKPRFSPTGEGVQSDAPRRGGDRTTRQATRLVPTTRSAGAVANARPDPSLVAPARRVAFEILRRVEEGAHSTDLLRDRTPHMDPRDRGLASELVLGVLRYQSQLDHLIQHFAGRELSLVPDLARALRLGVYQLRYLDRIPPHAAVDEAVELARLSSEAAAGLCNAVLRKVTREPVKWPDRATTLSMPTWLLRRWDDQFGKEAATKAAESFLEVPKTYVRVPQGPDGAMEPPPGAVATEVKGCYLIENGETSGYRFQDISSQAVVGLLDLKPGQTFADLAAAPGGKYLQAMETPGLLGIAADANYQRATQLPGHNRVVADATRALPFAKPFDRILLDAPCSGTGTIGRNPEIRWRIQPGDLTRYHERQVKMLTEALKMLAKGGRLVYSTCSLEPEENEQVIRRVAADFERVKIGETMHRLPGREAGDGFFAAVLTTR